MAELRHVPAPAPADDVVRVPKVDGWITVERSSGRDAIERVYRDTLDGRADPRRGYI
jgi:hypothetical protein